MNPDRINRSRNPHLSALIGGAAAALFVLTAGVIAQARPRSPGYAESLTPAANSPAQPQRACRLLSPAGTVDLWSVCGDTVQDDPSEVGSFTAVGNVTIGLEPDPQPIVRVGNPGGALLGAVSYGTNPLLGRKTAIVIGDVGFQAQFDDVGEHLVGSGYIVDPIDGPIARSDILEWDVVRGKIGNTAPQLHDNLDGPIGSTFDLFWADIAGTNTQFWGHELTQRDQLTMTLDLYARRFTATIPVTMAVNASPADDISFGMRVIFSETGFLSGGLSDVSPRIGPATLDLSNINIRKGEFEAETVELMADKNPDLAMLADPVPQKPGLIARFTGLKYKDRKWSIKGTEVSIRDLTLGDAVKLKANTLGIEYKGGDVLLKIRTTLDFGDYLTSTSPITTEMRIGITTTTVNSQTVLKPYFDGGIAAFVGNMGPLKFNLTNVKLQGDPLGNFFGLNAQNITMQWASQFGGQSQAGLSGLKLGVDKTRKFKFEFNGGTLQSPPISTGTFSGTQFIGTVGAVSNTLSMTFTGNVNIKIPGGAKDAGGNSVNPSVSLVVRAGKNVRSDCNAAGAPTPCFKRIDGVMTAFSIKLAGFKLALATVRPSGDGGFEVGQATLTLPLNFGGGGASGGPSTTINGFKMLGNGDVSIAGGQITLPPLKVAGMTFGSFTGGFSTQMVNVGGQQVKAYSFTGGAKLSMPGLEPSADKSISVSAKVVSIPSTNEIDEVDTTLTFEAHPGIPIASSGVELTKFTGGVHFKTGAITFTLGIGVDSTARLPPTGNFSIPIVGMTGNALVRPDPFAMTLGAQLKILIFNVASAQMQIGDGAGFNACPPGTPANTPVSQCPRGKGFYAQFNVDALFIHGNAMVRIGKVNGVRKFAGTANLNFGLEKGQFGFGLPRKDRTLAGISFAAGEFNIPGTSVNTVGMKGTFEILGYDYSLFMDFNKSLGSGSFLVMDHNLDQYQLVGGGALLAAADRGEPGYAVRRGLARPDKGEAATVHVDIPLIVAHEADTYFGIHYSGTVTTTPSISLTFPCTRCVPITAASHNSTTIFYDADFSPVITKGNDIGFVIKDALATTWTLHIDNAPPDFAIVFYVGNKKPVIEHVKTGSSSSLGQLTSSTLTVIVTDTDSPGAITTFAYGRVDTATNTLVEGAVTPIFTTTAQGTLTHTWFMSGQVPSGVYRWVAEVNDGKNAPVTLFDTRNLTITDNTPPAAPGGMTVLALPRSVQASWNPNPEKDLSGYEIGYGPSNDPNSFIYTRTMGDKEINPAALARASSLRLPNTVDGVASATQFDGALWGLQDGAPIFVGVRAYDESGNYSPWTMAPGAPWSLSPQAVSPAPDFFGEVESIQAAFGVPLKNSDLIHQLIVRDEHGDSITGTIELLYGFNDGDVVGMRFRPEIPMLAGIYAAVLLGGEDGINTPGGNFMPADYVWTWKQTSTLDAPHRVYMPMVRQ